MRKILFVSLLVLFAGAVWAEDLGALAKKEKARREALKKSGKKATTFTNQDVPSLKSSLGIESSGFVSEPASAPTSESAAALDQAIDTSNSQLEDLKRQKAELTNEIQSTSESIEQTGTHSANIGQQYREKRLKEAELRKVEEQIEALEKENKDTTDQPDQNN